MQPEQDRASSEIKFAHAARLELDELLEQLVARARDVQETQGRLRGLLRAYSAIARADDLDVVLRHIVEAARELVNARYAAIGVVADGRLTRFVHTGMDDATVAAIDHLPEGKGLLGLLVDYPQTLRLRDIAEHVASVGFPDNHPPMHSLLGAPIQVGDRVFGNLYLTEKQDRPEFTSDDEELVQALAAAAATAIDNAMLLDETRRRQRWQVAMMEIVTGLLAGDDPDEALKRLVRHAQELVGAEGAGVNIPVEGADHWRVAVTVGSYTRWQDVTIPMAGSVTAAAVAAGDLIVVDDPTADARTAATTKDEVSGSIGQTLAVPLRADRGVIGVLVASRRPGTAGFDPVDRDVIRAIAAHAGLALEIAEVRRDNESLRRIEDRAQIADRLRQQVIQRLFQHGLALQVAAGRATGPEVRESLQRQVVEVDDIIKDIRTAIFTIDSSDGLSHGAVTVAAPDAS
jgi:two-component system, NarL family, sensor histidine kinase DevS